MKKKKKKISGKSQDSSEHQCHLAKGHNAKHTTITLTLRLLETKFLQCSVMIAGTSGTGKAGVHTLPA